MIKNRGYQYNFSEMLHRQMYDAKGRERKAKTMIAVLSDFMNSDLKSLSVLDVGSSTGIIANFCSNYFGKVGPGPHCMDSLSRELSSKSAG